MTPEPCPCGWPAAYLSCCGRYHLGALAGQAPTPEALMRSRYSAFVKDLREYLLDTWHPSTRPPFIEAPEPGLKWLGLSVRRAEMTGADEGTVEFVARSKWGGRAHRLHEISAFVREGGRWYYVDAPQTRGDVPS
ncbi:YchJ family protein [Aquabacterium sp.]|uniref:YchJ family protein n=1 Tax=Aquabacterium sp. TaxID=1872578 RepID=UPI003D6CCBB5